MVIPKQYRKVLKQIGHHHWFWYRIDDWAHGERYKFPNHVVAYLLNGEIITLRRGSNIVWSREAVVETNIYDKEEIYPNCTVQVLTNTTTGEVSVGWWKTMNKLIDAIDQEVPVWAEDAYERGFSYGLELAMHIVENMDGVAVERCEACPHYHAYVNAKQGRGLCDHFMHEMPEDGYCSEHGKGEKDGE